MYSEGLNQTLSDNFCNIKTSWPRITFSQRHLLLHLLLCDIAPYTTILSGGFRIFKKKLIEHKDDHLQNVCYSSINYLRRNMNNNQQQKLCIQQSNHYISLTTIQFYGSPYKLILQYIYNFPKSKIKFILLFTLLVYTEMRFKVIENFVVPHIMSRINADAFNVYIQFNFIIAAMLHL